MWLLWMFSSSVIGFQVSTTSNNARSRMNHSGLLREMRAQVALRSSNSEESNDDGNKKGEVLYYEDFREHYDLDPVDGIFYTPPREAFQTQYSIFMKSSGLDENDPQYQFETSPYAAKIRALIKKQEESKAKKAKRKAEEEAMMKEMQENRKKSKKNKKNPPKNDGGENPSIGGDMETDDTVTGSDSGVDEDQDDGEEINEPEDLPQEKASFEQETDNEKEKEEKVEKDEIKIPESGNDDGFMSKMPMENAEREEMDWKDARRRLIAATSPESMSQKSVSKENEAILEAQSPELSKEYRKDVWCHPVAMPEVGGIVVRMPLETELYRRHHIFQQDEQRSADPSRGLERVVAEALQKDSDGSSLTNNSNNKEERYLAQSVRHYKRMHGFVQETMQSIMDLATSNNSPLGGQPSSAALDVDKLNRSQREFLDLYLHHQETWQEVCLVLEDDEEMATSTTLVLNRPMAFKLSPALAHLILEGGVASHAVLQQQATKQQEEKKNDNNSSGLYPKTYSQEFHDRFFQAFGQECALYIGGPDDLDRPVYMLHGISSLKDESIQVAPGLYCGGVQGAVDGVLEGRFRPLDFRFFLGRHAHDGQNRQHNTSKLLKSTSLQTKDLHRDCFMGIYQPMACARSLILKQCISLPKPLWHEVMEICGAECREIAELEWKKRQGLLDEPKDSSSKDDKKGGDPSPTTSMTP